jgi:xanthine dehydrogenase YagT iron-sulfur-binding subunit
MDMPWWTRRDLLQKGALASGVLVAGEVLPFVDTGNAHRAPAPPDGIPTAAIGLNVNGKQHRLQFDVRTSLLDLLRESLGLTGSKKGCDHGQCGACTVLVNGRRINSCLTLAVMLEGDEVTTIEGLAQGNQLHPMQASFIAHDGFQCGYCTPGQICSAVGALEEMRTGWPSHATQDVAAETIATSDEEIRERMSGNICRCSAYPNIVAAIRAAAGGAPG